MELIKNAEVFELEEKIIIKDKELGYHDITLSPSSIKIAQKQLETKNEQMTKDDLKKMILKGDYIGDCTVLKYNRVGHLIQLDPSFFVVISMDYHNVFYVSSSTRGLQMYEAIDDTTFSFDNQVVDASQIELSHHFITQASERFKVSEDNVKSIFLDVIVNGRYICITHSKEDKSPAHLFAKDSKLVYVSLDFQRAVTSYANTSNGYSMHEVVNDKIVDMLFKEIKKLSRESNKLEKRNEKERLYTDLKVAQLRLDIYQTKSTAKAEKLKQELEELENRMQCLDSEWEETVDNIRRHAIALASFI